MSPMKIFIICLAFAAIVPTEALFLKKKIALLKTVPKLKKHKVGLLLSSVPKLKTQKVGLLLSSVPKLKTHKVALLSSVPKLKKQALGYVLPSLAGSAIAAVPKLKKQKLAFVLPSLVGAAAGVVKQKLGYVSSLTGSAVGVAKPVVVVHPPVFVNPGLSVTGSSSSQFVENSSTSIGYQHIPAQYLPSYQPTKTIVATGLPTTATYQHVNYPSVHTETEVNVGSPQAVSYQNVVRFQ